MKTIKKKYVNEFDKMNLLCEKFILNLIKSLNIS